MGWVQVTNECGRPAIKGDQGRKTLEAAGTLVDAGGRWTMGSRLGWQGLRFLRRYDNYAYGAEAAEAAEAAETLTS